MAQKVDFITPASNSNEPIPLAEIPKPVQELAENIYAHVRKTGGRVRLTWADKNERDLELRQLASYAAQRRQGKLSFRVSPTRNLPETVKDVRLTADLEGNGQAAGNGQEVPAKA